MVLKLKKKRKSPHENESVLFERERVHVPAQAKSGPTQCTSGHLAVCVVWGFYFPFFVCTIPLTAQLLPVPLLLLTPTVGLGRM